MLTILKSFEKKKGKSKRNINNKNTMITKNGD